ncbi:hypothetical protein FD755_024209, partial [Muntiacus reevesi]
MDFSGFISHILIGIEGLCTQRFCKNLSELTDVINSQINHLRGIVSEMQRSLGRPQTLPHGDGNPPSPAQRQENDAETNPGGISLQSAASPELQQLAPSESLSLPRIVSTFSLQPSHDLDSPFPRLTLSSIFSEGDEHINSDLSSAQDTLAELTADLPQAESSLPDNFETVRYSTINNRMNPDTALPSLCIAPNFEVAETSLENSPETMSYSTLSGDDSDPSSLSVNLSPNFGEFQITHSVEKFILTQMPIKEETGVENSSQTVYYPALLGNIIGSGTDSASHSVPPNFANLSFLQVILIEMPGQAETTVDNSYQIVGNETVVGSDSNPDTGSSPLSFPSSASLSITNSWSPPKPMSIVLVMPSNHLILSRPPLLLPSIFPSIRVFSNESALRIRWPKYWKTSLESDTPMMNQLPFLEYDSAEDASYIFIPSDFAIVKESSTEMNPEAENHASVIKNDSYQQIDSESFFLTSEFDISESHLVARSNTERSYVPFTQYLPIVVFCKNIPCIYMCSPSRSPLPPPSPSHPSGSSHIFVSMLFSQNIPPLPSP